MKVSKGLIFFLIFFAIAILAFIAAYNYKHAPIVPEEESAPQTPGLPQPQSAPPPSAAPNGGTGAGAAVGAGIVTPEQFHALTEKALKTLPRQQDTQNLTDEQVHFLPDVILKKSEILVQIVKAADQNPALNEDALTFYDECAQNSDLVKTIRARCLTHMKTLAVSMGRDVNLDPYPDDIKAMSNFLPQ